MLLVEQAIAEFKHHCLYEKNLSGKTIKFYTIDLKQFEVFLEQAKHPREIDRLDKTHIKDYLKHLSQWKPKTVKRKVATLKALFNFLEFEDLIHANPMRKVKIKIKEPITLPKSLTLAEAKMIFQSVYGSIQEAEELTYSYDEKIRNATVIELLFATGARVSEIANLKLADVNLHSGSLIIRGKGNKERLLQLCNPGTLKLLNLYYGLFQEKILAADGYLLINRLNKKLSEQSIRNLVKTISSNIESIGKKVTPHTFRHTFATLLLENDVDMRYIQSLLGHSSIITTQIYTQVNGEKQKRILLEKHPRMGFELDE